MRMTWLNDRAMDSIPFLQELCLGNYIVRLPYRALGKRVKRIAYLFFDAFATLRSISTLTALSSFFGFISFGDVCLSDRF